MNSFILCILYSVCHTSCELECSGAGPKGCTKCKSGWSHDPEIGCKGICDVTRNSCNLVLWHTVAVWLPQEMGFIFTAF